LEFLDLQKSTELITPNLANIGKFSDDKRAMMDFYDWTGQKMSFVLASELTSSITKGGLFGFGKKKATGGPGLLMGLMPAKKETSGEGFAFESLWKHEISHISTALAWSNKLGVLAVGNDSGQIQFIKPSSDNFLKFELLGEVKAYSDRIEALVIDEDKKLTYSISNDRKFKVCSIDKKAVVVGTAL